MALKTLRTFARMMLAYERLDAAAANAGRAARRLRASASVRPRSAAVEAAGRAISVRPPTLAHERRNASTASTRRCWAS
jgi:hypothetical protein